MKPMNIALTFFVALAFVMGISMYRDHRTGPAAKPAAVMENGRVLSATSSGGVLGSPERFAERAADYWLKKVGPHLKSLDVKNVPWRGEDDDTKARLADLGLNSSGDFCYYLFSIIPRLPNPPEVKFDNHTRVCRSEVDHFWLRAYVIAGVIETVLAPHAAEFTTPFQFYMDMTDGTRTLPNAGRQLGLPIVSWAYGQEQEYMVPFPDYYSLAGYFCPEAVLRLPETHRGWAQTMQSVYGTDAIPLVPWQEKKSGGIYRGTCSLTIDPESLDNLLAIRPELCQKQALAPYLDMGMGVIGVENPDDPFMSQMHSNTYKACAHCAVRKNGSKTRREMMGYKYQVVVDGWGTTCDSTHWKLLSNSVVIIVSPDYSDKPPWAFWYQPFLVPYEHFLPATVSEVGERIRWCRENDEKARAIAKNARDFAKASLTREGAGRFIYVVLRHLSSLNEAEAL